MKRGVLLINLGTPDHLDERSVYRYLTIFLNDPRVIDLPAPIRWILVNLFIIPVRYKKSLKAYAQIWTKEGSPLLCNSVKMTIALADLLGGKYQVALAMRYGNPSIAAALAELSQCADILVIPLFPQYSSAATGSALAAVLTECAQKNNIPKITLYNAFYQHPNYLAAYVALIKQNIEHQTIDHMVFSYHGLPERHLNKSCCDKTCTRVAECPDINEQNAFCYRAQCYATTRLIAQALNLSKTQYSVAFQSRLGRTPWIQPYLDDLLPELKQKGAKKIALVCPSFVADCLETLEEINIRARAQWQGLGGSDLLFIPCLNDHPVWIQALAQMVHEAQQ